MKGRPANERRPLRVLHVLEALEGGTARHLVDIVSSVGEVDHLVAIPTRRIGVPTDMSAADRLRDAGALVHHIEMRRTPLRVRNALALVQLVSLIRRERPTVVHGHSSIGGVLGRVAAIITGVPRVYTPHALATGRVPLMVERRLGRFTNRLVAVSESERDRVVAARITPFERVVVIPNGIELEPPSSPVVDLRTRLGIPPEAPLVGTIARLNPQKAPDRFVRIITRVLELRPDVHAIYIGDGPLRKEFSEAVRASPFAARLHHIAELPFAWATLGQLSVFVLTSRFEGGPYAPLEAMRAGVPIVLTDVVGNRDVVESGTTGYLVDQDNDAAFADAVGSLLEDSGRRRSMGEAAREWVRSRSNIATTAAALHALYADVAAQRPSRDRVVDPGRNSGPGR